MTMSKPMVALVACLLYLAASRSAIAAASGECSFEILVKTGNRDDAGTDARVSLHVSSASARGPTLTITNLESWGRMNAGHDYFEKGDLDRFEGTGKCMPSEPCDMTIKSDGSGHKPGWYVDYVKVSQIGQGDPMSHTWAVDQWLATDEAPHQLWAHRNGCRFAAAADNQVP